MTFDEYVTDMLLPEGADGGQGLTLELATFIAHGNAHAFPDAPADVPARVREIHEALTEE